MERTTAQEVARRGKEISERKIRAEVESGFSENNKLKC